jgi:hypothetical protein
VSAGTEPIFLVSGYQTSKDYERLADLMQKQSVICMVDYGKDCRDVAHTLWLPSESNDGFWQLSARGIGYVYGTSRQEFIAQCQKHNVEVIFP